jgi:uncharacterized membrane protein
MVIFNWHHWGILIGTAQVVPGLGSSWGFAGFDA